MGNILVKFCNFVIKSIGNSITWVLNLLPQSPFHYIDNSPIAKFIKGLNWVIPIDSIIAIGEAWLVAIGIFYLYQVLMRWVKMIE